MADDGADIQKQVDTIFSEHREGDDHKPFWEFRDDHTKEQSRLLRQLVKAGKKGLTAAIQLAVVSITEENLNPSLVKLALGIFLTHSEEAHHLGVIAPPIKVHHEFTSDGKPPLSNPVTPNTMKGVEMLAYFREDYDFNDHHYYWHLVYPYSGILEAGEKHHRVIDRQGELFLYKHSQMTARYNAESLSWGLEMTHAWGYDDILEFGYTPVPMVRDRFGARPPFQGWFENHSPHLLEHHPVPKKKMNEWRNNVFKAIECGFFYTKKRSDDEVGKLKITADNAMNWVGVVVEAENPNLQEIEPGTEEYIDRSLYGSLRNYGHEKFAEIGYHEYTSNKNPLGVMSNNMFSPRDPCFWLWHRHIDEFRQMVVKKYSHNLKEFQPEAKITEFKIIGDGDSKTPKGGIATYLGPPQLELNEANAKLNHEPYHWELTIESTSCPPTDGSNPQTFTVRLFIAPKVLIQVQSAWIEMDKFIHTLTNPKDTIKRRDTQSTVARKTPKPGEKPNPHCLCGWPQNMMLPIGTPEGMPYVAFAMLTNDKLVEDGTQALSFCGAKDNKYPDPRGMGYPFDKTWASRINSTAAVQEIIEDLPHTKLCDFTIYRYTKLYQGDFTDPPSITWATIEAYFTADDKTCMSAHTPSIDLGSQQSVSDNAAQIYAKVSSGAMPKDGTQWTTQQVTNFDTWKNDGCP